MYVCVSVLTLVCTCVCVMGCNLNMPNCRLQQKSLSNTSWKHILPQEACWFYLKTNAAKEEEKLFSSDKVFQSYIILFLTFNIDECIMK